MFNRILKWIGILLIAYILFHWATAGQDEIIEGPPECLNGTHDLGCPSDG